MYISQFCQKWWYYTIRLSARYFNHFSVTTVVYVIRSRPPKMAPTQNGRPPKMAPTQNGLKYVSWCRGKFHPCFVLNPYGKYSNKEFLQCQLSLAQFSVAFVPAYTCIWKSKKFPRNTSRGMQRWFYVISINPFPISMNYRYQNHLQMNIVWCSQYRLYAINMQKIEKFRWKKLCLLFGFVLLF